jgi:hypothetical protein
MHRSLCVAPFVAMLIVVSLVTSFSFAGFMDGTVNSIYGAALSTQNTDTSFGNSTYGDPIVTDFGGSEIDQVFGIVRADGRLYVTVAGNLENNFNKLEVFIDSIPGGVNGIDGTSLPMAVDAFAFGGLGTTDGALQRMDGLIFDNGFSADYYLTFTHGYETLRPGQPGERSFWALSAHYAELGNGTAGDVVAAGMQLAPRGLPRVLRANGMADSLGDYPFAPNEPPHDSMALLGPALPGLSQGELIDKNYVANFGLVAPELEFAQEPDLFDPTNSFNRRDFDNTIDLRMALDNSNTVGVNGGTGATTGNPQDVTTGLEFSIPLSSIGNPTGAIRLTIFINGAFHDYVSNQFSGIGTLQGDFGGLPPDLELEAAGNQYVVVSGTPVVPEPSSLTIALLMGFAISIRPTQR